MSSAKSERSDSSVSLDVKPMISRTSGGRTVKQQQKLVVGGNGVGKITGKGSPNSSKKELVMNGGGVLAKTALEKHAHKVANLTTTAPVVNKVMDGKVKTSSIGNSHKQVS